MRGGRLLTGRLPAAVVVIACVGGLASSASATYPGKNGRLFFGAACEYTFSPRIPGDCARGDTSKLRAVDPRSGRRLRFSTGDCAECDEDDVRASPDGRRVAFERTAGDGGLISAFTARADGSKVLRAARGAVSPAWSPSGRALALGGSKGVRVVKRDGSPMRRISRLRGAELDWSATNRIVLTVAGFNIATVDPRSGAARRLTRDNLSHEPSWSPNGRSIVFSKFARNGRGRGIYVMRADGSGVRRIVAGSSDPVWSPDGRRIAYSRGDNIAVVRPDGSRRRVIYRMPFRVIGAVFDLAWQRRPLARSR